MSKNPRSTARRVLGLAALPGLGLGLAAPAAHAAAVPAVPTLHEATAGLADTPLYPLAHTPLDLLSNNLHVPVGGMDVSTFGVTAPFHDGLPLGEVPVVGRLLP
jgi:hypothetical protein